jgi:hypothetical protein
MVKRNDSNGIDVDTLSILSNRDGCFMRFIQRQCMTVSSAHAADLWQEDLTDCAAIANSIGGAEATGVPLPACSVHHIRS